MRSLLKDWSSKQVLLYKFGESCHPKALEMTKNKGEEIQYFFNKLYVAASRATERLFIIDSEKGDVRLWSKASHPSELATFMEGLDSPQQKALWSDMIELIPLGDRPEAIGIDNLEEIALIFEREGLKTENPELLRRAGQAYQRYGKYQKADTCEAWALKFSGQIEGLGNRFLELGEMAAAWDCFWQEMAWQQLLNWSITVANNDRLSLSNYPLANSVAPLIDFMATYVKKERNNNQEIIEKLRDFTTFVSTEIEGNTLGHNYLAREQWQNAISAYGKTLKELLAETNNRVAEIPKEEWRKFGQVIQKLSQHGYEEIRDIAAQCFYVAEDFETAVECWSSSNNKQKKEYLLAKNKIGMSENLENLEDTERIISEWEEAGQPRDKESLQNVAPALEKKKLYAKAFIVYCTLDNPAKVQSCFKQANPGVPEIKQLKMLLEYYLHYQHWKEAIDTVETYLPTLLTLEAEKIGLKYDIIHQIASSELTPEALDKNEQQKYERFIRARILNDNNWQKYLLVQHMGIALEKIGSIVLTFTFYEQYISHIDKNLRLFARERWLATKKKQEKKFRQEIQISKAEKAKSELHLLAQTWQISLDSIELELKIDKSKNINRKKTKIRIEGLPKNIKVEYLQHGIAQIQIDHLIFKIMELSQQVLITDLLTGTEIRLSGKSRQIKIGAIALSASGGSSLSFTEPSSGYHGIMSYDGNNLRVEVKIQELPDSIIIVL